MSHSHRDGVPCASADNVCSRWAAELDHMLDLPRPSWDKTWMTMAEVIGRRSLCDRRQVGAVIVSADNAYIVVGYNGPPAGFPTDPGTTCVHWCSRGSGASQPGATYGNCPTIHAEANALVRADYSRIRGGTIYTSSSCCFDCAKKIANSGIVRVVMPYDEEADAHRNVPDTMAFLRTCNIEVVVTNER